MKISTRGRYSLEALLYLALLPEGETASTRSVSGATHVSDGYLEQLFIPLKKASLIEGVRGAQGGYRLGKKASEICVGDILRAVEGPLEPVACIGLHPCPHSPDCSAHNLWSVLFSEIEDFIDHLFLSDIVESFQSAAREGCAV